MPMAMAGYACVSAITLCHVPVRDSSLERDRQMSYELHISLYQFLHSLRSHKQVSPFSGVLFVNPGQIHQV